ncbi:hypothetical protein G7A66_13360 [Altererythrobacter sp. SALINAS58]|uniref:hypothetical protein n=1 Tax=Alteripontixanthobacter muriae TaxID=2705546 RepID=UPI00157597CB|nr:hypothetical protein [Alteripontixanthobacter muriae]NTZ44048.1 hypothetical protein [Alteripontixanthobacter muriae]
MARPSRPQAERAAVLAAAGDYPASWAVTRKASALASKVVAELVKELQSDRLLTVLEQLACQSPVLTLATDPEINTLDEIVERQVERLRARHGRHLSPLEHRAELSAIAAEVEPLLAGRYDRHLRAG